MSLRGLSEWNQGEWVGRGAEHAAEIVVWAISDGTEMIDFRLDADDSVAKAAALLSNLVG